jgi:hypothetical protein
MNGMQSAPERQDLKFPGKMMEITRFTSFLHENNSIPSLQDINQTKHCPQINA